MPHLHIHHEWKKWLHSRLYDNEAPSYRPWVVNNVRRALGEPVVSPETFQILRSWNLPGPHSLKSFVYAPHTNQVLALTLKAGATTALKRLEIVESNEARRDQGEVRQATTQPSSFYWNPAHRWTQPLAFSGARWMWVWEQATWTTTVRNPYARFVSAYTHLKARGKLNRSNGTLPGLSRWLARGSNLLKNRHLWPQTATLVPKLIRRLDFIIPVESMHNSQIGPSWFRDITAMATDHASPNTLQLVEELDSRTILSIQDLYSCDFQTFGYSSDPARAFEPPTFPSGLVD